MIKHLMALALAVTASSMAHGACWKEAGARYRLDPDLLKAIALTESGMQAQARHDNKDGSYDIGLMQINSRHFPRLAAYGITEKSLHEEPCSSVMAGAWILAEIVQRMGYNWNAVGAYNAGAGIDRQNLRDHYAGKVARHYRRVKQQNAVIDLGRRRVDAPAATERK